jgi:DNA mismatch repair protein MutL
VDHRPACRPRAYPLRAGDEAAGRRTCRDAAAAHADDLQLTAGQQIDYARIADELHALGFDTEPFGNRTIAVKAAPAGIGQADLEKVLFEILEIAEDALRGATLDELRRNICASIACQSAIKINTRLDMTKMDWLLKSLAQTDSPMSCPHGRPIAMHYSTREILKAFHRI